MERDGATGRLARWAELWEKGVTVVVGVTAALPLRALLSAIVANERGISYVRPAIRDASW